MRREDALLTVAGLSVSAFVVLAGASPAVAVADPGGSNGNGGNSSSAKGPSRSGASHNNSGNSTSANGGSGSHGIASAAGQTKTGKSSSKANDNAGGRGNNVVSGAQSNSGSDSPAAVPTFSPPNPPQSVVVAEQHTGTAPARTWSPAAGTAPPIIELHAPSAPSEDGAADLLSADHTGIPVWAAAEPIELRGDLFGLAGLVLMPLVGLVVGYRQAKAARDLGQTISG